MEPENNYTNPSVFYSKAGNILEEYESLGGSVHYIIIVTGLQEEIGEYTLSCSPKNKLIMKDLPLALYDYVKTYIKIHKKHCLC